MSYQERRFELLRMEGSGFNESEIVKHLSQKYQVSERQVYYDFETRPSWQPAYQQFKKNEMTIMKAINRYEYVYREASFLRLRTSHENIQLGALKVMLDANRALAETCVIPDLMDRLKELEEKAKRGVFVP